MDKKKLKKALKDYETRKLQISKLRDELNRIEEAHHDLTQKTFGIADGEVLSIRTFVNVYMALTQ